MLVIGSVAAKTCGINTEINDIDVIGTYSELETIIECWKPRSYFPISNGKKYRIVFDKPILNGGGLEKTYRMEFEVAWPDSTAANLLDIVSKDITTFTDFKIVRVHDILNISIANLEVLYALKMSHRYLKNSPHFHKTMDDIRKFRLKLNKKTIHPKLEEWFKEREKETYDYGHPKLNQSKEAFFSGDGVPYKYDHDSIHEAVATVYAYVDIDGSKKYGFTKTGLNDPYLSAIGSGVRPAYKFYQSPERAVQTSKNMFFALPYEVRLRGVMEEAQVLALERAVIPHGTDKDKAFDIALQKVCTSITSGWFREFAWENYEEVRQRYNKDGFDYVDRFHFALEKGLIKKYGKAA